MAKNIFIASTRPDTGKSVVCLGLINALRGIVSNVGYFKPIGQRYKKNETYDKEAIMIKNLFNIEDDIKDINPLSIKELNGFIVNNEIDVFFQKLQQSYKKIEIDKDVIIIDGIDNAGMSSTFEFDINTDIANNMAATVLLVEDGYITVSFWLTEAEQESIRNKLYAIDFFHFPDTLIYQMGSDSIMVSIHPDPCWQFLRIADENKDKILYWRYPLPEGNKFVSRLLELINVIINMIEDKPEYQALPLPRGGRI